MFFCYKVNDPKSYVIGCGLTTRTVCDRPPTNRKANFLTNGAIGEGGSALVKFTAGRLGSVGGDGGSLAGTATEAA